MPSRHPLFVMLAGIAVSLAMAMVIMLLTGTQDKGRAQAPARGAGSTPFGAAGDPVPRSVTEPVIATDFPDPDMIKVGDAYYAYATNAGGRNVQVAKAPAATGPWTVLEHDGMPVLGAWARPGLTWAPEVLSREGGGFLLYYTARQRDRPVQCIGAAVATTPVGPFTAVGSEPLICPKGRGDTIDAAAFTDVDGARYLLYRSGSGVRDRPTAIFIQRMGADGLRNQGPAVRILTWDGVEPRLVEAPALVRRGGRYHLFYANGDWRDASYRTGYATAPSVTGPYRRAPEPLLTTDRFGRQVTGPGGADLFQDEGGDRLVFHGVLQSGPPRRGMYVAELGWDRGRPVVRGIPERYQAESGRAAGAQVRADLVGASGGMAVGYLDRAGSRLELEVFAPAEGFYSVRIRYANRSDSTARHELRVNGGSAMAVDYGSGPTKGWADVTVGTALRAGVNVVHIRQVSGQADLDYVEIS